MIVRDLMQILEHADENATVDVSFASYHTLRGVEREERPVCNARTQGGKVVLEG